MWWLNTTKLGHLQILLFHGHEHGDQLCIMLRVERDHAGDKGGEPPDDVASLQRVLVVSYWLIAKSPVSKY